MIDIRLIRAGNIVSFGSPDIVDSVSIDGSLVLKDGGRVRFGDVDELEISERFLLDCGFYKIRTHGNTAAYGIEIYGTEHIYLLENGCMTEIDDDGNDGSIITSATRLQNYIYDNTGYDIVNMC